MVLRLPAAIPTAVCLGFDSLVYLLSIAQEVAHRGWSRINFWAAFRSSTWQSFVSWVLAMIIPPLWIILYYYTITSWLIPALTQNTCRHHHAGQVSFVSKSLVINKVDSENWPIALPAVTASVALYTLPMYYMVFLNFYNLIVLLGLTSHVTDRVALTLGRVLGPRPDAEPQASDAGNKQWKSSWSELHKLLASKLKDPNSEKAPEFDSGGAWYNAPTSAAYRSYRMPVQSGSLMSGTGKNMVNKQPQDLHAPLIAVLLLSQVVQLYAGSSNGSIYFLNYAALIASLSLYSWQNPGQSAGFLVMIGVHVGLYVLAYQYAPSLCPFTPGAACSSENTGCIGKVQDMTGGKKTIVQHPVFFDVYSTINDVSAERQTEIIDKAKLETYCGGVRAKLSPAATT